MASYRVLIKRSAVKELEKIPSRRDRRRIAARIRALVREPRGMGCEKLAGRENAYRIRKGRYRVVYSIEDRELVVFVVRVAHRKDVYR